MLVAARGEKKSNDFKINNLPFALKNFLNKKGNVEGAEIPE